jgi:hypothetical protein
MPTAHMLVCRNAFAEQKQMEDGEEAGKEPRWSCEE